MQIVSRKTAVAQGLQRYFTGKPCKNGHVEERYLANGRCLVCLREQGRNSREADPQARNLLNSAWRRNNPGRYLDNHRTALWRRKGLYPTRPEPNNCELCGKEKTRRTLHLDHCHKTNAFRGWLCSTCNTGIGKLGDTSSQLLKAYEYLKQAEAS